MTRSRGILTTARSGTVNDIRGQKEDKRGHELSAPMGSRKGYHPSLQTLLLKRFRDHDTLVPVGFWIALRLSDSGTRWQNAATEKTTDLLLPLGRVA
jgi:hypothetical protein